MRSLLDLCAVAAVLLCFLAAWGTALNPFPLMSIPKNCN